MIKNNREKWFELIEQQKNSGQSQVKFCSEHQINYASFGYYKKALAKKSHHLIHKQENEPKTPDQFSPVHIKPQSNPMPYEIKLSLPNGIACVIPNGFDLPQVKKLVEVLLSC